MKIKNLNPLELHIEKIVLAVAVLGAGYLAYACWSNPTLINVNGNPDGEKTLPPEQVEGVLKEQLTLFKTRRDVTNRLVQQGQVRREEGLTASVDSSGFLAQLAKGSRGTLDPLTPKTFAPVNIAAGETKEGVDVIKQDKIASPVYPEIVGPVIAEVFQGVVGNNQGGAIIYPWDANVVRLTAQFPMGKLRDAVRKYTPNFQVVLVTNAQWERSERLANGGWSDYKPMPALGGPPPTTAPSAVTTAPAAFPLSEVVAKFNTIRLGTNPGEAQDYLAQIKANTEANLQMKLPAGYDRDSKLKPMFSDVTSTAPKAADRAPADDNYGGTVGEVIAPAPGTAAPQPGAPGAGQKIGNFAALTAKEMIDLVAYDDTMQPGREYKYRVRLSIYNPLYAWPKQFITRLEDQKAATIPFVQTPWVEVATPVKVDPTEYFFVVNAGGLAGAGKPNTVRVELFKRKLGVWFKAIQDEVPVGGQIGVGQLALMNKNAGVDFATDFSVVDVISTGGKVSGVVLTNVVGNLVARSVIDDATSPKYKELDALVKNAVAGAVGPTPP
jgi:hypothetical protein